MSKNGRSCGALSSRWLCCRYSSTASVVSYGQLLTTFQRAGNSKVSLDGSFERHLRYVLRLRVSQTLSIPQSGNALWPETE